MTRIARAATAALLAGGCAVGCGTSSPPPDTMRDRPDLPPVTVTSLAFSPDGQLLAAADGPASTVTLWDISTPTRPQRAAQLGLDPHPPHSEGEIDLSPYVSAVRFAPAGRTLVAEVFRSPGNGPLSSGISLWNLADPAEPVGVGTIPDPGGHGVFGVAFSPAAPLLAVSGYNNGATTLWDTHDPAHPSAMSTLRSGDAQTRALSFSPDGATLAIGGPTTLWDIRDPTRPAHRGPPLGTHQDSGSADSVTISPVGHVLAIGGCDGRILLYNIADPDRPLPLAQPRTHSPGSSVVSCVTGIAFSPDARVLAAAADDGDTTLWDTTNPAHPTPLGHPLRGHPDGTYSVAFSPDGRLLATGGNADSTIQLWDLRIPTRPTRLSPS